MINLFQYINESHEIPYIIIRCFILFLFSIILIRFGNHRYQLNTTLDLLLVVILGSLVSRGMNGSSTLILTIVASTALVLSHKLLAKLTFLSRNFEILLKGKPHVLMDDQGFNKENMAHFNITEHDLMEQLRQQFNTSNLDIVEKACLERNGHISFIRK